LDHVGLLGPRGGDLFLLGDLDLVLVVGRLLEVADRLAESIANLRKLAGPEDQEHDDEDDEQLTHSEAEHAETYSMRGVAFQMPGAAWAGGVGLALGALVYDGFLFVLRPVDRAFPSTVATESTWWFGYARDLANLVAFLLFAASFRMLGLPTPMALLAGGVWVMGAYGLDYLLARALMVRHPHRTLAAFMV